MRSHSLLHIFLLGAGAFVVANLALVAGERYAVSKLTSLVSTKGPNGENVFNADLAESLMRGLAGQVVRFPVPTDLSLVQIAPNVTGEPVPLESSALGWATLKNATQSILAPLYMATPTKSQRFLRAVDPGTEPKYASMYGVLLYAGAMKRNEPPPGKLAPLAPGTT